MGTWLPLAAEKKTYLLLMTVVIKGSDTTVGAVKLDHAYVRRDWHVHHQVKQTKLASLLQLDRQC